jgi:cysteine desulfurase
MSNNAELDKNTRTVYADYAATTPMSESVRAVIVDAFDQYMGNPSSLHREGRRAHRALDDARLKVATILNVQPNEIIFTSGGSESDTLAIMGAARAYGACGKHIIITSVEHKAILESARALKREGFEITMLPVDSEGVIDLDILKQSIRDDTILISIMYVNNEIGTIEPIQDIASYVRERRAKTGLPLFHTDACQAAGYLTITPQTLGVDLLTLNGAKLYGPRGVGILYRKNGVNLSPIIYGGNQESMIRAGTENVPAILGFAHALEESEKLRATEYARLSSLRTSFIQGLRSAIPHCIVNGNNDHTSPHIVHVTIPGIEGEAMLLMLDEAGIAVATGSACSSNDLHPSHVLEAIGHTDELIHGSIRFSFGRDTTPEDISYILDVFPRIVNRLRSISSITSHV